MSYDIPESTGKWDSMIAIERSFNVKKHLLWRRPNTASAKHPYP
jgi:hypothetical protein